jgi:mannitol-1-phosphate 5-dehydrogenase
MNQIISGKGMTHFLSEHSGLEKELLEEIEAKI